MTTNFFRMIVAVGTFFLFCSYLLPPPGISAELGEPLLFPTDGKGSRISEITKHTGRSTSSDFVDTYQIEEVRNFYLNTYAISDAPSMNWTGDYDLCNAGTNDSSFTEAVRQRVNYFRSMAGMPGITFTGIYSEKAIQAALMMSANDSLSHEPPTSWSCYTTEGAEAAGSSNLSIGSEGWNSVTGQMKDHGSSNSAVGHRRWILYPPALDMGTGSVPGDSIHRSAMALWVFGTRSSTRPPTREAFVAWPPAGYVPYQVVYPRWSFSYPNADFSSASVSMVSDGVNVPVNIEPLQQGYGDNSIVWIPNNMGDNDVWPAEDIQEYTVVIDDVLIESSLQNFTYTVKVFDPFATPTSPGADFTVHSTDTCTGIVNFKDRSFHNEGTSWNWSFPGGSPSSSTLQNPSIEYATAGIYTVELTVSDSSVSDTVIKTDYLTIYDTPEEACSVQTQNLENLYQMGIYNFVLNTIQNTTGSAVNDGGYLDFSCLKTTQLLKGENYPISIEVGDVNKEYVFVYIDFNDDNILNNSELIFQSSSNKGIHAGTISIPSTAVTDTLLRMRVMSDFNVLSGACSAPQYGQVEDYGVIIKTTPPPPQMEIDSPSLPITSDTDIIYSVTYTDAETVTLSANDITLNATETASATVGVSGTGTVTRTVTLSNIQGNGTLGITIAPGTASNGGQTAPGGTSSTVIVDNIPPYVKIISPTDGSAINDDTPLIDFSVTDNNPGITTVNVDGNIVAKSSGDSLDALADGSHTLSVIHTDAAGNVGSASSIFTVEMVTVLKGDLDDSKTIELKDALIALQILSGITPPAIVQLAAEVDGNGSIGLEEAVYILQEVSAY